MIEEQVILQGVMGSRSVGTDTADSDYDFMSVVLGHEDVYLGMDWWGQQGTKEVHTIAEDGKDSEHIYYEIVKFLRLCQNFNPNVVPLLWLRPEDYLVCTPIGQELLANRDMFNSKKSFHAFAGYAYGQLKKMGLDGAATGRMGAKRKALRDKYGYDTKYAYHTIRLAHMLHEFLDSNGTVLNVYRKGLDDEYLISIRNGAFTHSEIMQKATSLLESAKDKVEASSLPDEPDKVRIRDFCKQALRKHLSL